MSGFKDQIKRDIANVFNNSAEFADSVTVVYNGKTYDSIPVVIDNDISKERTKRGGDNSMGIYAVDLTVFISFENLGIVPRKETPIVIDGIEYSIVSVSFNMGEIALDLEMLDE